VLSKRKNSNSAFESFKPIDVISIPDEKNKGRFVTKKIRYIAGESSIFVDEQGDDVKDSDVKYLRVHNNLFMVDHQNDTLKRFMDLTNFVKENEHKRKGSRTIFTRFDKRKKSAEVVAKKKEELGVEYKILNMDFESLRRFVLSVSLDNSEINFAMTAEADELKLRVSKIVASNPKKFLNAMDEVETAYKAVLREAIYRGILSYNRQRRSIAWGETNQDILAAPVGKDAVDYFASLVNENSQVKETYADINAKLNSLSATPKIEINEEGITREQVEAVFDKALESNVISKNALWYKYGDTSLAIKREAAIDKIYEDSQLFEYIKADVES